ncbi:MAG: hypothetical protein IPM82_30325 [Saprospiraceae bacterium]|nr:hypothetical protein [Saprospiraceae bacterium]
MYSIDNGSNFGSTAIFTNPERQASVRPSFQDANGCQFDEEVLIEQPNLFDINVEPQVSIHLGESYQLNTLVNVPVTEIEQVDWFRL